LVLVFFVEDIHLIPFSFMTVLFESIPLTIIVMSVLYQSQPIFTLVRSENPFLTHTFSLTHHMHSQLEMMQMVCVCVRTCVKENVPLHTSSLMHMHSWLEMTQTSCVHTHSSSWKHAQPVRDDADGVCAWGRMLALEAGALVVRDSTGVPQDSSGFGLWLQLVCCAYLLTLEYFK